MWEGPESENLEWVWGEAEWMARDWGPSEGVWIAFHIQWAAVEGFHAGKCWHLTRVF